MRRVLSLLLLCVFVGCSRGAEVRLLDDSSLPGELYGEVPEQQTDPQTVRVLVYFVRTDSSGRFLRPVRLGAVPRELSTRLQPVELAARLLLQGPTAEESEGGYNSAVPPGTELIGISVDQGVVAVNLSAEFEAVTSQLGHLMRISQIVWTLTELPEVDSVQFRIHGVTQPVIDQRGVAHERVGRGRYSRYAPRDPEGPGLLDGSVAPVVTGEP